MTNYDDVYIYTINDAKGQRRLASMLPEEATRQHGLKSFAIVGEFKQNPGEEETFIVNPAYLEFLAWAIARHIAQCPTVITEAQKKQNGRMYITDARSQANGSPLTEDDIIGLADVKDGKLTRFAGNQNYRPFTEHGFMKIEPWLNEKIREELLAQVELQEKVS